ncbi:C2H2-type domain-containing protein [Mycena sanguinolenta]|uniref:C2H2-type domain-containing protein n=1 Tax=Mycena sanguinolenta TaxID=230812 RepID=A0A8H7CF47_9AGAR|nr:C2H2-type domain-containing protein [Mycena sanguinolenta]
MASNGRRTHRKRVSALRLSSDTTSTLPEYVGWRDVVPPPEYEADADAEEDTDPPTPVSPRQYQYRRTHRRRTSSPPVQQQQDVLLDSLLERSVHALELSNALLQSSMAAEPSSSAFPPPSITPEPRYEQPSVSRRMILPPPREPAWADDLAAIARDVDELLVSSSLPASGSPVATRKPPRRRPSLDPAPRVLTFIHFVLLITAAARPPVVGCAWPPPRASALVAPAPRAITQYVAAGDSAHILPDDDHIALPSTIGLRAPPSEWSPLRDDIHEDHYTYHPAHLRGRDREGYHPGRVVRPPQIDGLPSPALGPNQYPYPYTFPRDLRRSPREDEREEGDEWVTIGARDWAPDAASALRSAARVGIGVPRAKHSPSRSTSYAPTLPNIAGSLPTIASMSGSLASLSPKLLGARSKRDRGGSVSPKMGVNSHTSGTTRRGRSDSRSSSSGSRAGTITRAPRNGLSQSTPDLRILPHANFTVHANSSQIIASLPSESPAHSPQSSSSEGVDGAGVCKRAKEARSALRKILDEAPKPPPPPPKPKHQFFPRSPPPVPYSAPSTATASVSRLFSKGGRHSVTQPAPAPAVGIMKGGSRSSMPATPIPSTPVGGPSSPVGGTTPNEPVAGPSHAGTPSTSSFFFGIGSSLGVGTDARRATGSGASTPSGKRISFAELPESYAASSEYTGKRRVKGKGKARAGSGSSVKGKGKGKGKAKGGGGDADGEEEGGGGWLAWFVGGALSAGVVGGAGGMEERERERERYGSVGAGGERERGVGDWRGNGDGWEGRGSW